MRDARARALPGRDRGRPRPGRVARRRLARVAARRGELAAAEASRPELGFAFAHDGVLVHGRFDLLRVRGRARARRRLQDQPARGGDARGVGRARVPAPAAGVRARRVRRRGERGRGRRMSFLERPDEPVRATFARADVPELEAELSAAIAAIQEGDFRPTPSEFACAGCPALDVVCAGPRLAGRSLTVVLAHRPTRFAIEGALRVPGVRKDYAARTRLVLRRACWQDRSTAARFRPSGARTLLDVACGTGMHLAAAAPLVRGRGRRSRPAAARVRAGAAAGRPAPRGRHGRARPRAGVRRRHVPLLEHRLRADADAAACGYGRAGAARRARRVCSSIEPWILPEQWKPDLVGARLRRRARAQGRADERARGRAGAATSS